MSGGQELSGDAVKRKKHASDVAVTPAPPTKSRRLLLLDKSSSLSKNTSLSTSASYDFADRVTHESFVPRMSELEVCVNSGVNCTFSAVLIS